MDKSVISSEYYGYEDPAGLRSIDPRTVSSPFAEPEIDLTAPASCSLASDAYSTGPVLPSELSMATRVRVTRGTERTLTLGQLLREAATDPQALADVVQIAQAKAGDASVNSACYMATENNLVTILAQLSSRDQTARREGALALTHFILHSDDHGLQRGLLATVDQIRTPEAKQVLTEVYRQSPTDSPLHQWMEGLPTHGLYLKSQSQAVAQGAEGHPSGLSQSAPELMAMAAGVAMGGTSALASTYLSNATDPALLASLTHKVEGFLNRPEAKALGIDSTQAPAIAQRLIEVGAHTRPDQLIPTLRAVVMSQGWNHPELTTGNFSQLAGLAEAMAQASVSTFNSAASSAGRTHSVPAEGVAGHDGSSVADVDGRTTEGDDSARSYATVRGFLGSLVQLAFYEGAESPAPTSTPPLTTLANAGMQGAIGSIVLANGGALGFSGAGLGSRPSYYVEGPSDAEGDTREGFGGNPGGGSQNQGESRDQDQPSTYA